MFKTSQICKFIWVKFFLISFVAAGSLATNAKDYNAPSLLTYNELGNLYDSEELSPKLQAKLNRLLNVPFIDNSISNNRTYEYKRDLKLGEHIRVALWNIERGIEYEAIEAAFTDTSKFIKLLDEERFPAGSKERQAMIEQVNALQEADVIILNEADWGVKRSGYRNVAKSLAEKLNMNYAFGVQFVELSPVNLSREKKKNKKEEDESYEIIKVKPESYKGLHGVAILSRFKLENVRLKPFKHQPYNWYESEKNGPSLLEKGKRKITKEIFLEKTLREVRRGGRTTLYAEIADEKLPNGRVTLVATHLENRSKPKGRVAQLKEILTEIKDIDHPVILAGDMNTSGKDLRPTSIQRELTKRFGNPKYWIKKGVFYALGFGLVEDVFLSGISFGRTQGDPTVKHIPILSPNKAERFFDTLEDFEFTDGGRFDFRGDDERSANGRGSKFSNSNQRDSKGFVTTYQIKSPIKMIGSYKLDWFFIKPFALTDPDEDDDPYKFAPHNGRTLDKITGAKKERISDHHPMTVDLPLEEPRLDVIP